MRYASKKRANRRNERHLVIYTGAESLCKATFRSVMLYTATFGSATSC
jgi:hypothetical protein